MKGSRFSLPFLAILVALHGVAWCAVYPVGPGQPYSSISEALDQIAADTGGIDFAEAHTVRVDRSVYASGFTVRGSLLRATAEHPLIIEAVSSARPVIVGAVVLDSSGTRHVTIDGLEIRNGLGHGIQLMTSCSYITIRGCHLASPGKHGIYASSVAAIQNVSIRDNICTYAPRNYAGIYLNGVRTAWIYNNLCAGNWWGIVTAQSTSDTLIYNNVCYSNTDTGILLSSADANCRVCNNTCYGNGVSGISKLHASADFTLLANNICWARGEGSYAFKGVVGGSLNSNYNDLYATEGAKVSSWAGVDYDTLAEWQAGTGNDLSSISKNPDFVSIGKDFHLWVFSPCVDAGQDLRSLGVLDDFDGDGRPVFEAYDIGADECEVPRRPPPDGMLIRIH